MATNTNTSNPDSGSGNNAGDSPSLSQDYIDHLKGELEAAERCYAEACAEAEKAKDEYIHAEAWKKLLEAYFDRIEKTLELASDVLLRFESTKTQSVIICENLKCTVQAIQILIMEVKETSECIEELKGRIKILLDLIDCLNDPALDPAASIYKCIMDLKTAVDEALSTGMNAIKAVLNLLTLINILLCKICDSNLRGAEGQEGEAIQYSLIHNLEVLISLIKCDYDAVDFRPEGKSDEESTPKLAKKSRARALKGPGAGGGEDDCAPVKGPTCQINPKPCLCFDTELETAPDPIEYSTQGYYYNTQSKYKNACDLVVYKKCLLDKAKEAKSKAQSLRDAIKGALEAAETAKDC